MVQVLKIIRPVWSSILRPVVRSISFFFGFCRPKRTVDNNHLRVLIAGGYGYGNVGDEAQLSANLEHWRRLSPGCRLTVLTPNLKYTLDMHSSINVELAPRKALFSLGGKEYFGSEKRFKALYPLVAAVCLFNACLMRAGMPTFGLFSRQVRLLHELNRSDVLFLSGGGYLTGMTLTRLWDSMLLIRLASVLGVPTILSGQTIGVFQDSVSRILARWGLKKAAMIYMRDPVDSPAALAKLGIPKERYRSTFDDALFIEAASASRVNEVLTAAGIDVGKPYIAVNVHYWGQSPCVSRVIMANIGRALDRIYKKSGHQIVFVPMVSSDETAIEEVKRATDMVGVMPKHAYRPDVVVGLVQRASICVTMKHHPIIFAMAAGVPTVSISFDDYYYHKNHGAMSIFNQERYLLRSDPCCLEEKLCNMTMEAIKNKSEISKDILCVVEKLRPISGDVIRGFLKNI